MINGFPSTSIIIVNKAVQPFWMEGRPTSLDADGPTEVQYDSDRAKDFELVGGFDVIARTAREYPDKVAVDDGQDRLTYAQFVDRVYGLAERLNTLTEDTSIVASVIPNNVTSPIVIMACALTGRILVPIDAAHPLERQRAIFSESCARVVLLAKDKNPDLSLVPTTIPRLIVDPLSTTNAEQTAFHYDRDAPLFVTFTSGSTGRPKGVVSGGRYGGIALRQFVDMFHLNSADVVLGLASLSTGGARDAFAALGVGATIRLVELRAGGIGEMLQVMRENKITVLSFVPSALRVMLGIDGAEQAFKSLRVLDLHGERILASDIALFRSKLPRDCLISVTMGSVEAGALFSWFVRDDRITSNLVPIGYIVPGKRVALLDEQGVPVADGEVGELFARGPMAMGAWHSGRRGPGPFLPDPDDSSCSIYPMGDLVRKRPDGLFEYVGRKDRKVKVRGLWADLSEVEAVLRMMDGVTDAAAIAENENTPKEQLVAFIVMAPSARAPSVTEVRRAVARETADHMAPAVVHVLDFIPRLANFKPDLMRLRSLSHGVASGT
jgi:acyl-coenzyme A synthetase/AMP-(fatty) acid ligase